jgi:hypothetical protein
MPAYLSLLFIFMILMPGCATDREQLLARCSQYENTDTIPAEVNNVDRLLDSLAGLFEGGLAGLLGSWVILSVNSEWVTGADTVLITSMIAGTVIGWYIAGPGQTLKKGEFSGDEMKKTCANLRVSEDRRAEALKHRDKLPVEYDLSNVLWALAGFSAGSSVGYFFGTLIGYSVNNSGGAGNAFASKGGLIGGSILGLIGGISGGIYGWNAPERFMSDDDVVEKVLKGNYMPALRVKGK